MATPKSSPWGAPHTQPKPSFRSILQEEAKQKSISAEKGKERAQLEEEEQLILLALERSKQDYQEPPVATAVIPVSDEDDELKRALELSLLEQSACSTAWSEDGKPTASASSPQAKPSPVNSPVADVSNVLNEIPDPPLPDHPWVEEAKSENDSKPDATTGISLEDQEAIERALREADKEEHRRSMALALELVQQDQDQAHAYRRRADTGNVRVRTRAEMEAELRGAAFRPPKPEEPLLASSPGFRMNSDFQGEWTRMDQHSIVGPNNEIRTKHDLELNSKSNAHRMGLDRSDDIVVGNKAYNSFLTSVRKNRAVKGVAAHGTGRAGSDADNTRRGMDQNVRLLMTRAINNGLIGHLNGIVKEGKEAVVHHADGYQGGDDVAVKIFKRMQEFRGRGDYVDADPRYGTDEFKNASGREKLALWAEKEFRNLMRAHRVGVPVPRPLWFKDNVLLLRFIGQDGWPSPQLRELDLRRGSPRWITLYEQVLQSLRRLYHQARLVHGDLSEYNILVGPAFLLFEQDADSDGVDPHELRTVFIDFGQAVDTRHPAALELLERDVRHINTFFKAVGVPVLSQSETVEQIVHVDEEHQEEADEQENEGNL